MAGGKGGAASTGIGRHDAWYNSSMLWTWSNGPVQCQILIPLSTRNRGESVAVRRNRPSGDHSQCEELAASILVTLVRVRRS